MKKTMRAAYFALLGAFALSCANAHANLLTNAGFETGDTTGWTRGGNLGFTQVVGGPSLDELSFEAGPIGSDGTLSQWFATVAGTRYELDFWLWNRPFPRGDAINDFAATIDGNVALSLVNSSPFDYAHYVYEFVASSNSALLEFTFRNDPSYWELDRINVDAVSVPEPGALAIFGLSLLGLGAALRRKQ